MNIDLHTWYRLDITNCWFYIFIQDGDNFVNTNYQVDIDPPIKQTNLCMKIKRITDLKDFIADNHFSFSEIHHKDHEMIKKLNDIKTDYYNHHL